jgi:hypothetical protein
MQNLSRGAAVALYAITISQLKGMDFESRAASSAVRRSHAHDGATADTVI